MEEKDDMPFSEQWVGRDIKEFAKCADDMTSVLTAKRQFYKAHINIPRGELVTKIIPVLHYCALNELVNADITVNMTGSMEIHTIQHERTKAGEKYAPCLHLPDCDHFKDILKLIYPKSPNDMDNDNVDWFLAFLYPKNIPDYYDNFEDGLRIDVDESGMIVRISDGWNKIHGEYMECVAPSKACEACSYAHIKRR